MYRIFYGVANAVLSCPFHSGALIFYLSANANGSGVSTNHSAAIVFHSSASTNGSGA
nr:hypothetical protein [uncultured Carboxylicivirga sp.]